MGKLSQNNRIRIIIATSAILMWVVYSVTTLLGLDVVFNLTSPIHGSGSGRMISGWRIRRSAGSSILMTRVLSFCIRKCR